MKIKGLLASCFVLLISCNSSSGDEKATTPEAFNDRVYSMEQSLGEPLLKAEADIRQQQQQGDFKAMAQTASAMEDSIDLRIRAIGKMKPLGVGGEDFKTAAVRYFEYLKRIYSTYGEIALASDLQSKDAAENKMARWLTWQTQVLANLRSAQAKYAADNSFVF